MCDALAEDFSDAQELNLPASSSDGRRGKFIAINFGISYGGGQKEPRTLSPPSAAVEYVDQLKENPDLRRLAAWQSEIFASYQPKAYHHVRCKMARLHAWRSSLRPPFPRSVYTTACVNCGPSTECCGHHDLTNYPGCPCCITALGEFDAERGGHCVLHGLRIYVPFPAGASCLLSSAGLMHGNTAIQPGENRYSFTQYCVGGLMRWVSYGCKPAGDIPMDVRAQLDEEEEEGWEAQYARFSKVWEVDDDRKWVREQEAKEGYEG
ncbi:hypothetical protein PENSPDRAFT_582158 [Peniophora sp. CONT]|nr:hypothetical protein PENSPDRAFT_582158 [Peniophora sp. CONT]